MVQETWVLSQVASYQSLKMVLDTSLLNTQHYKVRIKSKVEQSRESIYIYILYIYIHWLIGQVSRVFANGPGDLGSIPGCVIPKTLKMVLDTSLLKSCTQHYKVRIKSKVCRCVLHADVYGYELVLLVMVMAIRLGYQKIFIQRMDILDY